jgi:retinol dehydrogenase-12
MLSALQFWNGLSTQGKVATATAVALPVLYGAKKFFAGGVNKHRPDLTGKVALITGANTGIGLETAKYLAKLNCEVLVTVRDDPKGRETTGKIKEVVPNAKADYFKVELSSLKSVRNFVEEYKKKTNNKKIDFLIENAGVMIPPYTKTEDGFELQFGVNHLAHFLMADLLIKNNLINEPGRIVVVSSYGHTFASNGIQFDDLNFEKGYNRIKAYGQSKLANILFAKELTKRMKAQGKDIIAVSLHPGSVKTELARHVPAFLAVPIQFLSGFFMKSPYEGAQTTLHCALSPDVQGGEYFSDCKAVTPSKHATDSAAASKLWDVSEKLVGLRD